MTLFDYAVLLIVGTSILISVMRGLVREILALLAWLVAFWIANLYTAEFAPMLPDSIPTPELRLLAGFVILFLVTLLVMTLVTIAVAKFIKLLGLGPVDKGLGALFGVMRGMLIVLVLVFLAGLTTLPKREFWRNAMFSAPLEAALVSMKPWLPQELAKHISYN
jgi:membrane protein required for colicin V production